MGEAAALAMGLSLAVAVARARAVQHRSSSVCSRHSSCSATGCTRPSNPSSLVRSSPPARFAAQLYLTLLAHLVFQSSPGAVTAAGRHLVPCQGLLHPLVFSPPCHSHFHSQAVGSRLTMEVPLSAPALVFLWDGPCCVSSGGGPVLLSGGVLLAAAVHAVQLMYAPRDVEGAAARAVLTDGVLTTPTPLPAKPGRPGQPAPVLHCVVR